MNKKTVVIVAGGNVDTKLLENYLNTNTYIIGADKGLEYLEQLGIKPDFALGDFDSASFQIRESYIADERTMVLNPMKDYTDSHVALMHALEQKPECIYIFGATGSRIDHMLGNIQLLYQARLADVDAFMIDSTNKIQLIDNECTIKKDTQYGKYVSVIPFGQRVSGIDMQGFVYELKDATISQGETIGISNEIREEEGHITIRDGYLIVLETKD